MSDSYSKLKVAAVQAVPVFLDREASTAKACKLIKEAGKNGARIIVFPEGFIPSHPIWYHFHPGTGKIATSLSVELFKNSVEIPGPEIDALCKAAREAGAYVIMGVCEKLPNTTGTMYNTQVYISPDGIYIGKHQKIMPTVGERFVHKGGNGDTFGTFDTEYGPVSALMCSENSNPLAVFALTAEGTRIHAAAWPNHWGKMSKPMRKYVEIASKNFAQVSKAYVISACSIVDDETIEKMQLAEDEKVLLKNPEISGGSMIISPDAEIIAGPMSNDEGILYADIDLEQCVVHKLHHDFSGNYNRPDIFNLYINKDNPQLYYKRDNKELNSVEASLIYKLNSSEEEQNEKK